MNRGHAYANGSSSKAGYYGKEGRNISISPSRFQPRSQSAYRRRRTLFLRLVVGVGLALCFIALFVPSLRAPIISTLSLGLFSDELQGLQLETVRYYDLSTSATATDRGWEREERVLMCAPLRDAESHLPMFFSHLRNLTYPHHLIDLAFLVSDSKDNTLKLLSQLLNELQNDKDPKQPYGEISVIEKDFGQKVNQDVESRHGFAAQASRRKLMAQARNWLLSAALRPTHSWVYWRDVDVETAPFTILEDLMRHNKHVIVPNVWRPLPDWLGGEQPYDLNSWQESETALALADTLDEDAVIVEGYAEYATWRPHLAYLRDPYGDPDMEMEIDGVGGVSILAKAAVFRAGVHFPAFSFEKHAETEGFGKMAKRMRFSVVGLPHYTVWHLYEPSVDDIRHMEEMEQERRNRENEERERAERAKKIKEEFGDTGSQWEKDKSSVNELTQKDEKIRKEHDAAMAEKEKAEKAKAENQESDGDKDRKKEDKDDKHTQSIKDTNDDKNKVDGKTKDDVTVESKGKKKDGDAQKSSDQSKDDSKSKSSTKDSEGRSDSSRPKDGAEHKEPPKDSESRTDPDKSSSKADAKAKAADSDRDVNSDVRNSASRSKGDDKSDGRIGKDKDNVDEKVKPAKEADASNVKADDKSKANDRDSQTSSSGARNALKAEADSKSASTSSNKGAKTSDNEDRSSREKDNTKAVNDRTDNPETEGPASKKSSKNGDDITSNSQRAADKGSDDSNSKSVKKAASSDEKKGKGQSDAEKASSDDREDRKKSGDSHQEATKNSQDGKSDSSTGRNSETSKIHDKPISGGPKEDRKDDKPKD